jgi:signal transduction histidine kinase
MIKRFKISLTLKRMFVSLFFIYFLLLVIYLIYDYRQVIENAKSNSLRIANISSLQVHSTFQQISNILLIIDDKLVNKDLSPKELSDYLSSMNLLIPDIETIKISDKTGKTIASSNYAYIGRQHIKYTELQNNTQEKSNQLIFREDEKSLISNEELISFNYRKMDNNNVLKGAISAYVPIRLLYNFLRNQQIDSSDEINIINLRTCKVLGSSSIVGDHYISKYITPESCKHQNINNSKVYQNSTIDPKTGNAVSYIISPLFKIATFSIIAKNSYLYPFYKKILIIFIISTLFALSYWQLIKQQIATEKKLHDERALLTHASKMASLGEMASGIAHEINNPLSIAVGMLQQAIKSIKKINNPELSSTEKIITTTLFSLERITKIIHGMKVISRYEGSNTHERVLLSNIFSNSTIFYQEKLKNKNTELLIAPIPEISIFCNETQISQLVINLIGNSSDAIERQEERWIHINFELIEKDKKVKIYFTDSGKGIPKEVLTNIMKPFFTTKAPGHGTGLGLTIINKIVKEHNGNFEYNEQSLNTQFVVTLNYENNEKLT